MDRKLICYSFMSYIAKQVGFLLNLDEGKHSNFNNQIHAKGGIEDGT
jgi:hypothetical protein